MGILYSIQIFAERLRFHSEIICYLLFARTSIETMGSTESKPSIRRNDSSTSSFGRLSYPSPRYHVNSPGCIKDLSRLRQNRKAQSGLTSLVRTSSLDLGRVAEEERTFLIGGRGGSPKIRKMYVDEAASSSLYVVETLKAPPISQWLVRLYCSISLRTYILHQLDLAWFHLHLTYKRGCKSLKI